MDTLLVAVVAVIVLACWVALGTAVVSCLRTPQARWRAAERGKGLTIALIAVTGGIGGMYYWWRIRPELRDWSADPDRSPTAAELRAVEAARSLGR